MVAHLYHINDLMELPNIAAYAYRDVHVWSALRPACAPLRKHCLVQAQDPVLLLFFWLF